MNSTPVIAPGIYTVGYLLGVVGLPEPDDYRTVKIDGLGFDFLDKKINVLSETTQIKIVVDETDTYPIDVSESSHSDIVS